EMKGTWGGMCEIAAAAEIWKLNIQVIYGIGAEPVNFGEEYSDILELVFINGDHYDFVQSNELVAANSQEKLSDALFNSTPEIDDADIFEALPQSNYFLDMEFSDSVHGDSVTALCALDIPLDSTPDIGDDKPVALSVDSQSDD